MAANMKSTVSSISKAQAAREEAGKLETIKVTSPRKTKVAGPDVSSLPGMVRYSFSKDNRLAVGLGLPMAAGLPVAAFILSHVELPADFAAVSATWNDWASWMFIAAKILAVLGILLWSALTVNQWGKRSFRDAKKALGFTVGVEIVMLISDTLWLSIGMCALLVAINVIGTTVNIALGQKGDDVK